MARKRYDFDLIIIGSGAGGSIAAGIATREGKRVALIEDDTFGGECPNWGCVPTKALLESARIYHRARTAGEFGIRGTAVGFNYPSIKAWKDTAVRRTGASKTKAFYEKAGATVIHGRAHFIDAQTISVNRRHISSEYFLIASGSHVAVPNVPGLKENGYLTMREAVDLKVPPKQLLVIGGGAVGCEFAQVFATFGSHVTIADISPRLLPREDEEVSGVIEDVFTDDFGTSLLPSSRIIKVEKQGLRKRVTYQRGGHNHTLVVDEILVASGKLANTDFGLENAGVEYSPRAIKTNAHMQTTNPHIYAVGDCAGPYMFTHMAIYQSRIAVHNMLHRNKQSVDYLAVPRVTFLTPEVASVGMTEAECLRRDLPIKKGIAPLTIIGRSNVANQRDGFVKIIGLADGTILGASIVSPHAGEMIHEITLAIQHGLSSYDIANTIHAFPTWSEAIRIAASKI